MNLPIGSGQSAKQVLQIAILALALATSMLGQSKPDFSGVWKLNIDETEFTGPKPSASTFSAIRTVCKRAMNCGSR